MCDRQPFGVKHRSRCNGSLPRRKASVSNTPFYVEPVPKLYHQDLGQREPLVGFGEPIFNEEQTEEAQKDRDQSVQLAPATGSVNASEIRFDN
jgi:hypothetical protein